MHRKGIVLYKDNAQHAASMVSKHGWSLDSVANNIMNEARSLAAPYRKHVGSSYVDRFKVTKSLYVGPQHNRKHPVFDRIISNDDPAAHIIELGIVKDYLEIGDREQRVTELQRGHFFLTEAAAKAVGAGVHHRPVPASSGANWEENYANAYIDPSGGSGSRHNTEASRVSKRGG